MPRQIFIRPSAPKTTGIKGKVSTRETADHQANFGQLKKDRELKSQEADRREAIEKRYMTAKKELEPFYSLFAIDGYDDFLKNCCENLYDHEFIFQPYTIPAKGSKKIQLLLLIMTLVSVANSAGSDPRVGNEEITKTFAQILESLLSATKATKKTFDDVVEAGIKGYKSLAVGERMAAVIDGIPTNLIVSAATMATSKGQKMGVGHLVFASLSHITSFATGVDAKKSSKSSTKAPPSEEFNELFTSLATNNLPKFRQGWEAAKKAGRVKSLLRMSDAQYQIDLLFLAVNQGAYEIANDLLDEIGTNNPKALKSSLLKDQAAGFSTVLNEAMSKKDFKMTKLIFEKIVKYSLDDLEEILTKRRGSKSASILCHSIECGDEIFGFMLDIMVKHKPDIIERVFSVAHDGDGYSLFDNTAVRAKYSMNAKIVDVVSANCPGFLKDLVSKKLTDDSFISAIDHLLISGDWNTLSKIFKQVPGIKLGKLPASFFSNIPQLMVYYLDSLLNSDQTSLGLPLSGYKASYYQMRAGHLAEVSIDEITLSDNPILVELNSDNKKRKVVFGGNIFGALMREENDEEYLKLKNALNLADAEGAKNIEMVFGHNNHAVTLSLQKKGNVWSAIILDSNRIKYDSPTSQKEADQLHSDVTDSIKRLLKPFKIEIVKFDARMKDKGKPVDDTWGQPDLVIPNLSFSSTRNGSCDLISHMVGAALAISDGYARQVRGACSKIGPECYKDIADSLHSAVDKRLDKRFEQFKERLDKPSPAVGKPKVDKKEKSDDRQL